MTWIQLKSKQLHWCRREGKCTIKGNYKVGDQKGGVQNKQARSIWHSHLRTVQRRAASEDGGQKAFWFQRRGEQEKPFIPGRRISEEALLWSHTASGMWIPRSYPARMAWMGDMRAVSPVPRGPKPPQTQPTADQNGEQRIVLFVMYGLSPSSLSSRQQIQHLHSIYIVLSTIKYFRRIQQAIIGHMQILRHFRKGIWAYLDLGSCNKCLVDTEGLLYSRTSTKSSYCNNQVLF